MNTQIEAIDRKWIYIIAAIVLLWMGLGASFAYEMGKHGLENIEWGDVLKPNIPVAIISFSLMLQALKLNTKNNENS